MPDYGTTGGAIGGIAFIATADAMYNVYSAVHSSIWSAGNFGTDEETRRSAKKYLAVAVGKSLLLAGITSTIMKSWWPMFAWLVVNGMMVPLYFDALNQAKRKQRMGLGLPPDEDGRGAFIHRRSDTPAYGNR